jgi:hypothetical protein
MKIPALDREIRQVKRQPYEQPRGDKYVKKKCGAFHQMFCKHAGKGRECKALDEPRLLDYGSGGA